MTTHISVNTNVRIPLYNGSLMEKSVKICYNDTMGTAITVGGLVLNLFRREVIDMVTYSDLFNYTLVICAIVSICISVYKSKK